MSYLVLARKYRPQIFSQVVGQRPVVKTLQNSLIRNRVAHAILLAGVRGVGKTTLARIMAKAINCQVEGTSLRPCDNCLSCRGIVKGSSLDLYEIDGASNRGIQEIRELKEKIRFLPSSSQHRIIIIDEVHMLTTEAFNALLKTLEEPPTHVYFIFATTEINKVPLTILSRCQQYELKRIPGKELYDHFEKLAKAEGFEIEPAALSLIVREASGSVRDGLSLLDQMFSFGEEKITSDDVIEVLSLVGQDILMRITKAMLQGSLTEVFTNLEKVFNSGADLKRFVEDLMNHFRILLLCTIDGCDDMIDLLPEELFEFQQVASDYNSETLHLKLSLLMATAEDLKFSTAPRLCLETSFVKIVEMQNVSSVATLLGHLDKIITSLPTSPPPPQKPAQIKKKKSITKDPITTGAQDAPVSRNRVRSSISPEVDSIPADSTPYKTAVVQRDPGGKDIRKDWLEFIGYVNDRKIWMAQDLQRANAVKQDVEGELHLSYNDPVNCSVLRQKENHQLLTEFVLDFFQLPLKIRFILPDPDASANTNGINAPHRKRQQLANDPLVTMATEVFNGKVGDIRVGPRSR